MIWEFVNDKEKTQKRRMSRRAETKQTHFLLKSAIQVVSLELCERYRINALKKAKKKKPVRHVCLPCNGDSPILS